MIRKAFVLAAVGLLGLVAVAQQQPTAPMTTLKVGEAAPDFSLRDAAGKQVKLSDFKGKKNVVVAFYVLAFTGG